MSSNLYIGNIPFTTTSEEVRDLFGTYGTVESVNLITDRETGRLRGFGFVEMSDGGQDAIDKLNQTEFGGRSITVSPAKPRKESSTRPKQERW